MPMQAGDFTMQNETKMKKQNKLLGTVLLLICSMIWGTAFVSQSLGMESVEGFTFSGIRILLGGICLIPVVLIVNKGKIDKNSVLSGLILSIPFCIASNVQQYAFNYTPAGKISFITAGYMFFVPIFSILLKKKIPPVTWLFVTLGFVGLYFLCIGENGFGEVNRGDVLSLVCAVFFAIQILLVEKFSDMDGVTLSCTQFISAGLISCALMFVFEEPRIENIKAAALPILYAGIMSCGVAYTLQILGQKHTPSTVASLLMCTESVFGAISSALILGERLSAREITGCSIMIVAIVLSQIFPLKKKETP